MEIDFSASALADGRSLAEAVPEQIVESISGNSRRLNAPGPVVVVAMPAEDAAS